MQENNNIKLIKIYMCMKKIKAVLTFTVLDKHGEKTICNIIEPLDATLGRINERLEDLMKSYCLTGNVIIQFVADDNNQTK